MFDLGLAPVTLSFVGASNRDDLKTIRELQEQHGEEWPVYWLKSRELSDWGDLWLERYAEHQAAAKAVKQMKLTELTEQKGQPELTEQEATA
ncbi:hypothetical protein FACS1894187_22550 [Synergistales bacterium]|nr:hypothetical protein FACS1894187_22550 [Synergistales bacterium]